MGGTYKENNMEIGLIIYAVMMGLVVLFVITEYLVEKKLSERNKFKTWWRKKVIGFWDTNHPKV